MGIDDFDDLDACICGCLDEIYDGYYDDEEEEDENY